MSAPIAQLPAIKQRLDNALKDGLLAVGTRFLYTVNGSGKCYEGTLYEISPLGHVRLNERGTWDWPPEVVVEEILAVPCSVRPVAGEVGPQSYPENHDSGVADPTLQPGAAPGAAPEAVNPPATEQPQSRSVFSRPKRNR